MIVLITGTGGPQFPAVIILVGLGFGISGGIETFTSTRYILDLRRVSWLISVAYGLAVPGDVILTGALVLAFRRSRTGLKRSDSTLHVLAVCAVKTGLLTSVVSIAHCGSQIVCKLGTSCVRGFPQHALSDLIV
ncbi:hypothetical protein C8Q79DRAFT_267223 [Trametes meyenii]|nr:hypothetical protein C8Q79DRAFT_267223 [Trametes meyenii]